MQLQKVLGPIVLTICLPVSAWAGGIAHIEADGATTVVEFDGKSLMRLEEKDQSDAYMVMRDEKLYSVAQQSGMAFVIEIGATVAQLGDMSEHRDLYGKDVREIKALRDTGRSETVAGISGVVYELDYINNAGQSVTETLVLSSDPTVYELTQATMAMSEIMMRAAGMEKSADIEMMNASVLGKGLGVLRHGDDYMLSSIKEGKPAAKRFTLPAKPMDLSNMGSKGW